MPAKNPRTRIETSLHGSKIGLTKDGDIVVKGIDQERIVDGVRPANTVRLYDDFTGDIINANWNVRKGSDAQCVDFAVSAMVNGAIRATTGDDAAATMAVNGVQLESALNWQASEGGLFFETRIKVDAITAVSIFVGLTDQAAALEAPVISAGSANTITTNASDAVGIMFDTSMGDDFFWGVGVKADTDAVAKNLGVAPVAAAWITLGIAVDQLGEATFFVNGVAKGSTTAALTIGADLTPVVTAFARGAASRIVDVDYIFVEKNRF